MVSSVKRLLASAALASQLWFGSPSAAAQLPPQPTEISAPFSTNQEKHPAEDDSDLEKKIGETPLPVYFNWSLFYLKPATLPVPRESILSYVDLDELSVSTLGLSLDFLTKSQELSADWTGTLSVGVFLDFSSTRFFGTSISDSGAIRYRNLAAAYKVKGDLNYVAFGLTFGPSVFYRHGLFSIGMSIDFKGGLALVNSDLTFDIGLTDQFVRSYVEYQGYSPDASGSIETRGFGGFGQVLVGPVIGIGDVLCSGGVGLRYDGLSVVVREKIDNPRLMDELLGKYKVEYNQGSILFGAKCGYLF
ncbi:hypothetical protein HY495_01620 [Candidatus Woesearchaeota archaeon]|nr:hypothetical protein [Candidatus Woesearchaeota archaeon]